MAKKKADYDPWNAEPVAPKDETTVHVESPDGSSTPEMTVTEFATAAENVAGRMRGPAKSKVEKAEERTANTITAGQLRSLIERIERLEEERKAIADDIKEVYAEAKGTGFDTKAIRTIIRLRKKDQAERQEEEAMLHLYMDALGMR